MFYLFSTYAMYITAIKVNDDHKLATFELDQVGHFSGNIPP